MEVNFYKRTKLTLSKGRLWVTKNGGSAQGLKPQEIRCLALWGQGVHGDGVRQRSAEPKGCKAAGMGTVPLSVLPRQADVRGFIQI